MASAVNLADSGLYTAKRNGRDRWVGIEAGSTGSSHRGIIEVTQ